MPKNLITPIFIFSLPRSGSTLLQRILATNRSIATVSEPWILLPLIYMTKEDGSFSEYGHRMSAIAINEFVSRGNKSELKTFIRDLVLNLYQGHTNTESENKTYFIDKTPRYHLVCDDITELFPDAKFIFLWRNPLSIAASIIDTFGRGHWQLHDYRIDLYKGLTNLISCYKSNRERSLSIKFEDLITEPEKQIERIAQYLSLPPETFSHKEFQKVKLNGKMGDPTGVHLYRTVSDSPINKWKHTMSNPIRKIWAKNYLKWIGDEHLKIIGYDPDTIYTDLRQIQTNMRYIMSDCARIVYGIAQVLFEVRMLKRKFQIAHHWFDLHGHT